MLTDHYFSKESTSSDDKDIQSIYDGVSNSDLECERIEVKLGYYAVVLVAGKSRPLKFIARIDHHNEED